ncbi:ATP-binding protein [Xenorhabdus miraniensis]|uniref:DNA replication protein DnaC n=1 Tax=Xenorhabdus miraniensis TaxID=351674 RepID=A0A2D0JJJ0_9GAMM|nr:ATP-binding protein [Xenorhabdus miraniensis]PHM45594.1 DNA replication protein DnaC [Xenorhabdus miraniensis]
MGINNFGTLNIAPRFAQATFDTYQPQNPEAERNLKTCQGYVQTWADRKAGGEGLILCGRQGTGKTHLAVAVCREIATEGGEDVFITTASRIIRAFRRSWNGEGGMSEYDTLQFYSERDLLVIDEIGVQYGTESERNILFEVLNNRYEDLLPTILISNLPVTELAQFLGDRTLDRLFQGGTVLAFDWESYRRETV